MSGRSRHASVVLCWLVCLGMSACQTATDAARAESPRVLVTFHEDPAETHLISGGSRRTYYAGDWQVSPHVQRQIDALSERYRLRRVDSWPIKSLRLQCVLFEIHSGDDVDAVLRQIAAEPGVDAVQMLNEFDALATSPPTTPLELQFGSHAASLAALHRLTRGASVRVGMVDTLVDASHPDLRNRISRQYAFAGDAAGDLLHGTAVAGVIAASGSNTDSVVGMAPDAQLYVYGACRPRANGGARCNSFDLAKAFEQALIDDVEVLNLSLAGPHDPLLARLLSLALARGTIVVAALDLGEPEHSFPASMRGVWAVNGARAMAQSNAAPAVVDGCAQWIIDPERLSTRAGGGYRFFYGSSMSAAGVSGFAALLRSRADADQTNRELTALLGGGLRTNVADSAPEFLTAVRRALFCDGVNSGIVADGDS
jgi:subtilisin family serine protease